MKIKKITGIILCSLLIISILSGCSNNSEEIEKQIEEEIVGYWNAGSAYMCFFENGEMGMVNASTGTSEILPYEVEGDTVILNAKAATLKMLSVKVDEDTLTYISEQGHKNVWKSVSDKEVMDVLE